MPINDRLDKVNVVHIYHGILYSHKNGRRSCPLKGQGWSWKPLSSANPRRNRKPNTSCSYKWELNNENTWTQGREHHTPGSVGRWGSGEGIALGEIPNVNDRVNECSTPTWHMYTYVTNLHVVHMHPRT